MPKVIPMEQLVDFDHICPVVYAMGLIGQKWKVPILWHLADEGTLRYNELKRGVFGISNLMLTKSLQELEEHDLVVRKQYETVPPKVEYSLSARGQTLIPLLRQLHVWGQEQKSIDRALQDQRLTQK